MKSALLVIDYINGIVNGFCQDYINEHPVIENTNQLINQCRAKSIPVYFVRLAFANDYHDVPKHSRVFNSMRENHRFNLDSTDVAFVDDLDIQHNDQVIDKKGVSPFCDNNLQQQLQADGIEHLIFAGLSTDNAINLGVREAHDAGFYTTIVRDACGASSLEFHEYALVLLEKIANEIVMTKTAC